MQNKTQLFRQLNYPCKLQFICYYFN